MNKIRKNEEKLKRITSLRHSIHCASETSIYHDEDTVFMDGLELIIDLISQLQGIKTKKITTELKKIYDELYFDAPQSEDIELQCEHEDYNGDDDYDNFSLLWISERKEKANNAIEDLLKKVDTIAKKEGEIADYCPSGYQRVVGSGLNWM